VFAANADGGLTLTTAPERWRAEWPDVVRVARLADRAGLEFFLPIARWKGFGGITNSREWSFETFTQAAALAGATERIALFATVHVPLVHPLFAAKALATLDHASGGRSGLNIVCGWNQDEFAAFGIEQVADRYAQGREWYEVVARIHADTGPFDFDGRYFRLRGASGRPAPLQRPRPVTLSAAFSPAGRDFAAHAADHLLTTFTDLDAAPAQVADIGRRAAAAGRAVGVLATCHVVCRATQAEAEDAYERYAVTLADDAAVDRHMAGKAANSGGHDDSAYRLHRKRFAGGAGTFPLVGTPRHIAGQMARMAAAGFGGAAVSFLDYANELPGFIAGVLPLLRDAGLRQA
jgi:alkanesulfonate monooxygenase SsuD/methylene tetrahydromethanopterin reductase-like flavin-dependent oxidoreductase (luciferase family)